MPVSEQFLRQRKIILCTFAVKLTGAEFQFRLNSWVSGRNQIVYANKGE